MSAVENRENLSKPFQIWYENRHLYAKNWKENHKRPVIGMMCTYVPEEILYAAEMLPVRILGGHEPQALTESHIFSMFCPFSRDALAQGLKGKYDYVDAIVLSHSCLHFRQTFTSWKMHLPIQWSYYLPMPNQVQSPYAKQEFQNEVQKFKTHIEQVSGKSLTPESLIQSTALLDKNRSLLRKIYDLRKQENPPITGADAVYMALTSQFVSKEDHNKALEEVLKQVEQFASSQKISHKETEIREIRTRETGVRLMTIGSENDDVKFFEMVESLPATIVCDEQCAGSRYFWNPSVHSGDPVKTIANRYIDRPPCPTKDYPERRRFTHILKLVKEYQVQGVILMQEKFCDPHEADNPALKKFLEENEIPTLTLEFDSTNPLGPLKIRVEAFLETLSTEELFS
jgi:benzoyl-CoA reductase subunit C